MPLTPLPQPGGHATGEEPLAIIEPLCAVFRRKLKGEGLKYTPERAHILDVIVRWGTGDTPATGGTTNSGVFQADDLLGELKAAGFRVSKATVYRTIKLLQEAGIIQQVLVDAEQAHYQLAYGQSSQALLVRTDTKQITTLDAPEAALLRDRICAAMGLKADGHRLVIYARKA